MVFGLFPLHLSLDEKQREEKTGRLEAGMFEMSDHNGEGMSVPPLY